jgi:phospholipid/cholesterol/gamma-HCH transport system permease protein
MPSPGFRLTASGGAGDRVVELAGVVTLADGARLWRELRDAVAAAETARIDLSGVERLDGGGAALLYAVRDERVGRGRVCELAGATGDVARVLGLYGGPPQPEPASPPRPHALLADVGDFAHDLWRSWQSVLAFLGDLCWALARAVRQPRSVHFGEFGSLVERAGTDGLPIIMLINFLVGAILGLQGAIQLHRFGGDQFLASLVGLSVVRELGPLMTAILVTGRSGAAFAAELGTMKVNEEIDALRTLGQDPQRFLVLPRVLVLVLVVPVLTVVGDFLGTLGGMAIAVGYLQQPAVVYVQMFELWVDMLDVGTGLMKSVVFGAAIALVACQRGLAARGGAEGVGRSTTAAVVAVLFTLVALDAAFTWIFSLLDW